MPILDRDVSPAGTGWQVAIIYIPNRPIRLLAAHIENNDAVQAENAYIAIIPHTVTPYTARSTDMEASLDNGYAGPSGADFNANLPGSCLLEGPFSLIGAVYHQDSVEHILKVIYEEVYK